MYNTVEQIKAAFVKAGWSSDKVYLYLSGDSFEIMRAVEGKRHIQSDRLLGKYKYLALMVSNYFRFHLLRIA